jgi:hypothetical protein
LHIPRENPNILLQLTGLTTQRGDKVGGKITFKTSPRSINPILIGWYWYGSQYFPSGATHTLGNVSYPQFSFSPNQFFFDHSPNVIYVGYDSVHKFVFRGELDELTVDPQFGGDN